MKKIILFACIFISATAMMAQTGYLDTTFNVAGPVKGRKILNGLPLPAKTFAIDLQGRIVIAACSNATNSTIYVDRINADGSDADFKSDTTVQIPYAKSQGVNCMLIQPDGKILLGGFRTGKYKDFMVARLEDNGVMDSGFGTGGVYENTTNGIGGDEEVVKMALQSDGKIILIGKFLSKITVRRLNKNGSIDTTFAVKGTYSSTSAYIENASGIVVDATDFIYVLGDSYYNSGSAPAYYISVLKLNPNGTPDVTFGTSGRIDIYQGTTATVTSALALQKDGKMVVGGTFSGQFKTYRLTPSGIIDENFGAGGSVMHQIGTGSTATLTNALVTEDNKIILTGQAYYVGNYNYAVVKLNSNGSLDTSFSGGKLLFKYSYSSNTPASILASDRNLLLLGQEYPNSAVYKIKLRSVFRILGDEYALAGQGQEYEAEIPASWSSYSYKWFYNGQNAFFVPDPNGRKVVLFFRKDATDGTLICVAYNAGAIVGSTQLDIKVNLIPSDADELAKLQCPSAQTLAEDNYISNLTFNNLIRDSEFNENGYTDYTRSGQLDSLLLGDVYSVKIKLNSSATNKYVGIWLDYNNDGHFNTLDEFVDSAYTAANEIEIKNVILRNQEGYAGPKRLRIRYRPDVPLAPADACMKQGEVGETEDYLIILKRQDALQAPEIITPNEDGKNDYFVVRGVDPRAVKKLTVFDRWGEVKFRVDNYENNWNGKDKNGELLIPGTYYYLFDNGKTTVRGFLEIRY